MKRFFCLITLCTSMLMGSIAFASKTNFQFQVNHYQTTRQAGQTLDLYVRYGIKDEVDYSQYPDYREVRSFALPYLDPSVSLPTIMLWEQIAAKLADDLMAKYPIFSGVSVQIMVYPNDNGKVPEPGFHGAIYTVGDVTPLQQVVISSADGVS